MNQTEIPAGFRSGYVGIVGAPNAGKSTLLNQLLHEKISITAPRPQTTRNRIMGILTEPAFQIIFVDTPGIHEAHDSFNRMLVDTALATLGEVDAICFLVDVTHPDRSINDFIVDRLKRVNTPVILVLNKIDLISDKARLLPLMERFNGLLPLHALIPVSALEGEGVEEILEEVKGLLPEGPRYYPEDYITDQPERFLVAELIRERIFHLLHHEVPYAVAVDIEKFTEEPERRRITIEATIHVERDSQKAILIGKGGAMLKEIGQQARADIERLLGSHVYLGLFVKVQKNWRKDPRMLAELGYRPGR